MSDTRLRLVDVVKVYGKAPNEVRAVDDVTLEAAPGEVVIVMGPSGSGKTTLLAVAGGLLRPTSGQIWMNGRDLTALGERELPEIRLRSVGFVFQTFNLLENLTALENVAVVAEAAGRPHHRAVSASTEVMESLGLGGRLHVLPQVLSGGEKQRTAIARALVNDPPLLLADEPTGQLDSRTGHEVVLTLERTARERDRAVVVVTHDPRIADIADRILYLEDGRLSEHPQGADQTP